MIEPDHPDISIRRQCELVGLTRSSYYYTPATESPFNLELMRCIDEQYLKTPFYGWPRMTAHLQRLGYPVNHKRIQRLMQLMGLQAIFPKRRTTTVNPEDRIYPYLLRDVEIVRPNQVWSTEIVCTQMTKTDILALSSGGDGVSDLNFAICDNDAVDQELDQLALLLEGGMQ